MKKQMTREEIEARISYIEESLKRNDLTFEHMMNLEETLEAYKSIIENLQ